MNIIGVLRQEESKLLRQLAAIRSAIATLNGSAKRLVSPRHTPIPIIVSAKRTMSAAARAMISQAAKARWTKIRAEHSKSKKTK